MWYLDLSLFFIITNSNIRIPILINELWIENLQKRLSFWYSIYELAFPHPKRIKIHPHSYLGRSAMRWLPMVPNQQKVYFPYYFYSTSVSNKLSRHFILWGLLSWCNNYRFIPFLLNLAVQVFAGLLTARIFVSNHIAPIRIF